MNKKMMKMNEYLIQPEHAIIKTTIKPKIPHFLIPHPPILFKSIFFPNPHWHKYRNN